MTAPLVVFSHGKEGTPDGSKIRRMSDVATRLGFAVRSLDYRGEPDPDRRAVLLRKTFLDSPPPAVLVGSSMGAYVSLLASESLRPQGLFLLAPALYLDGYQNPSPTPVAQRLTVIHGWRDEVVPVDHGIRFAKQHRAQLHVVDADHRLLTAMPLIEPFFFQFLTTLPPPCLSP